MTFDGIFSIYLTLTPHLGSKGGSSPSSRKNNPLDNYVKVFGALLFDELADVRGLPLYSGSATGE